MVLILPNGLNSTKCAYIRIKMDTNSRIINDSESCDKISNDSLECMYPFSRSSIERMDIQITLFEFLMKLRSIHPIFWI